VKVFVTGATGFLGQRLVARLLHKGMDVRCLVRRNSNVQALRAGLDPEAAGRLEFCQGSLDRIESCARSIEGSEVVFHLAAELRGGPAVLFANNVIATRRLIEVVGRTRPRRFVLVSSLGVYGTAHLRKGDVLDERCPLDPEPARRDAYTYSKVAQEKVAWDAYRDGRLPLVVIRPGVIYGPGRDCLSARVGLALGRFFIRMGGRQQLPYTFVDNCARAIALAGTAPGVEGQAFNIVDDDLPSGRDLMKRYQAAVGPVRGVAVPGWAIGPLSGACEWYHRWSRGQLPAVLTRYKSAAMWRPLHYSNARAKAELGWRPEVGFEEGLRQTFSALRRAASAGA
jgi:nucleoside-diphosphate-sugar epimerase